MISSPGCPSKPPKRQFDTAVHTQHVGPVRCDEARCSLQRRCMSAAVYPVAVSCPPTCWKLVDVHFKVVLGLDGGPATFGVLWFHAQLPGHALEGVGATNRVVSQHAGQHMPCELQDTRVGAWLLRMLTS